MKQILNIFLQQTEINLIMTEINKLENKIKQFGKKNYSISDNGKGEKVYVIRSHELKQSLQDIVHSRASEEWKISYGIGQNAIEYSMEKDGKFGLYKKSLDANSFDEFTVLSGQNTSSVVEEKRKRLAQDFQRSEEIKCEELSREKEVLLRMNLIFYLRWKRIKEVNEKEKSRKILLMIAKDKQSDRGGVMILLVNCFQSGLMRE